MKRETMEMTDWQARGAGMLEKCPHALQPKALTPPAPQIDSVTGELQEQWERKKGINRISY